MEASSPDGPSQQSQNTLNRNVYASSEWWNDRFKIEGKRTFDWYVGIQELLPILQSIKALQPSSKILVVGCGNSRLSVDMYKKGYKNITNIDIAGSVLETMRELAAKEGAGNEMSWIEMDATQMQFPDAEFDLVIDKGTLDAVLCGNEYTIPNNLLKEMYRVVKPGCPVLIVTHSPPTNRKFLFEWNYPPETTKIYFGQVDLSPEVNMLNIFRSIGKQKSLSEIVKDTALFAECMAAVQKDTKQRMVIRKLKEAVTARVFEKRKQKAALLLEEGIVPDPVKEELFSHSGFSDLPFEKMEISVATMTQAEAASQGVKVGEEVHHNVVSLSESIVEGQDSTKEVTAAEIEPEDASNPEAVEIKKKTIIKVKDSGYNPPRQDHCFIYLVYKQTAVTN